MSMKLTVVGIWNQIFLWVCNFSSTLSLIKSVRDRPLGIAVAPGSLIIVRSTTSSVDSVIGDPAMRELTVK